MVVSKARPAAGIKEKKNVEEGVYFFSSIDKMPEIASPHMSTGTATHMHSHSYIYTMPYNQYSVQPVDRWDW